MSPKIKRSLPGGFFLLSWLLVMNSAFGYVRVEQVTNISEQNEEQMEIKSLTLLEGDKKRIDVTIRTLGAAPNSSSSEVAQWVTIIRLDKELIWKVNRTDRTHTEQTFASLKARREEGGVTSTIKTETGGEKKQINGYSVEPYSLILVVGKNGDPLQGSDRFTLVSRVWMTRDGSKAIQKLQDFDEKLRAKLGLRGEMEINEISFINKDFPLLKQGWSELQKAIQALKGYPIRIETQILDNSTSYETPEAKQDASPLPRIKIITEVKGIYTSMVFCSCTDKEKLFELWGAFMNLQTP